MIFKFSTPCYCERKIVGVLKRLIVETGFKQLIAVVIEREFPLGAEVAIPIERVRRARTDIIELDFKSQLLSRHDLYVNDSSEDDEKGLESGLRIEISGRTKLTSIDGIEVGSAREVHIDQASHTITHINFDAGITIGREVVLPSHLIKEIEPGSISLHLKRDDLKDLPAQHI